MYQHLTLAMPGPKNNKCPADGHLKVVKEAVCFLLHISAYLVFQLLAIKALVDIDFSPRSHLEHGSL